MLTGGGGRTSVSNIDMMKRNSSVECRLSNVSRYAISDIPDSKWQDLVWEQSLQHQIASILDEIVNVTADLIEEREAKRKAFEFTSDCLRIVWLRLFDWMCPRLEEPHPKRDTSGNSVYPFGGVEPLPLPLPTDFWVFGNVSPTIVRQPSVLGECE